MAVSSASVEELPAPHTLARLCIRVEFRRSDQGLDDTPVKVLHIVPDSLLYRGMKVNSNDIRCDHLSLSQLEIELKMRLQHTLILRKDELGWVYDPRPFGTRKKYLKIVDEQTLQNAIGSMQTLTDEKLPPHDLPLFLWSPAPTVPKFSHSRRAPGLYDVQLHDPPSHSLITVDALQDSAVGLQGTQSLVMSLPNTPLNLATPILSEPAAMAPVLATDPLEKQRQQTSSNAAHILLTDPPDTLEYTHLTNLGTGTNVLPSSLEGFVVGLEGASCGDTSDMSDITNFNTNMDSGYVYPNDVSESGPIKEDEVSEPNVDSIEDDDEENDDPNDSDFALSDKSSVQQLPNETLNAKGSTQEETDGGVVGTAIGDAALSVPPGEQIDFDVLGHNGEGWTDEIHGTQRLVGESQEECALRQERERETFRQNMAALYVSFPTTRHLSLVLICIALAFEQVSRA